MTDNRTPKDAGTSRPAGNDKDLPFRRSSSAGEYDPAGNWAAERRLDTPIGDGSPGMQGEASGAGDGGFGPEGGYSKDAHADDAAKRDCESDSGEKR
jgi:hypothetical protein